MIAVDTNLLVYAHREISVHHNAALASLQPVIDGPEPWALPWPCVYEFLNVATHPRIYQPPASLSEAVTFLESLFQSPGLQLLAESPGYFAKLSEIALAANIRGPRIHDARIAALCIHHGVNELWSADRDFAAFPKLRVRNPLVQR